MRWPSIFCACATATLGFLFVLLPQCCAYAALVYPDHVTAYVATAPLRWVGVLPLCVGVAALAVEVRRDADEQEED
jgi:hypothetical protein